MVNQIKIDFNPELFNDIYWHIKKDLANQDIRYIFLYGGSSASKTFTYVQSDITALLENREENVMVLRKFGVDIKDSIYSDYVKIIEDWGLSQFFKCQINYIECLITGSYIRFRGLDDSEKIKGLANFKRVVLEEMSQFEETDLKQIRKRLRGRKNQQIIGLFNPIDESHWIKTKVFDTETLIPQEITTNITEHYINDKGNFVVYKVTYLNNYYIVGKWKDGKQIGGFVDQHTIDDFEKDKITDFNYYQIYGLGNWGKLRTGGEFWKDFSANTHVRSNKYIDGKLELFNPELAIHMSWDENVNPYLTCLLWQIHISKDGKKTAIQFDEICLEDPRNRVKHVCAEFTKRYPSEMVKGLFVYGDRTSMKEDTKKEKGENFFTDVSMYLRDYKPTLRMQSVNPSVVQSGNFINQVYAVEYENISIQIGENCKKSIFDYSYALEDSDGSLKKSKKTNSMTGVSYEEFGHCFVGATLITTNEGEKRIDNIKVGDKVLTRQGYRDVQKVFNNGCKIVSTYMVGSTALRCTPNHELYTKNNGFKEISAIHKGIFCIFDNKTNQICYQSRYVTEGISLSDTQNQKTEQSECISQGGSERRNTDYTCLSMNQKLELLRKDSMFITKMETLLTTIFATSKAFRVRTMPRFILTTCQTLTNKIKSTFLSTKQSLLQRNGTVQRLAERGIEFMYKTVLKCQKKKECAGIAGLNIKHKSEYRSIAQKNVIINTRQDALENVYDIQVEGCHEYFANGILAHNCSDSKRYFITVAFANEYDKYKKGGRETNIRTSKRTTQGSY